MKKAQLTANDAARSGTAVRGMLRDIGDVLWLSRRLTAEMKAEKSRPTRPVMCEFCAVDAARMAA
jgi:hypothetical protein